MKHIHADSMALYAIDAQHSATPWQWWEWRDHARRNWKNCTFSDQEEETK